MIEVNSLRRKFSLKIGGNEIQLEDPNPNFSPEEIKDLYSQQYPQLLNSTIEDKGIVEETILYFFNTVAGTKG